MDSGRKVIILEDDEDIAELFAQLLLSYGASPVLCQTGAEVLEASDDPDVALALLDIMLPETDGRDVAASLRRKQVSFPIYFMTGIRESCINEDVRNLVDGILRKPFSILDLRSVLDSALVQTAATGAEDTDREVLELMTSLATEQESLRRQQAQLLILARSLETRAGPHGDLSSEQLRELAMGMEATLSRFSERLARIRSLLARNR